MAVAGLSLVVGFVVRAATYEVAQGHPQASDDGDGSAGRPWETISHAAAVARAGDRVLIRGGTYRERVVVKSSGTPDAPIQFEAAPGEHVIVTGYLLRQVLRVGSMNASGATFAGEVKWGTTWARHKSYDSLAAFEEELGIERGGRVLDPGFAGLAELDFRLAAEGMAELEESYPKGPVPGVRLGLNTR